MLHSAETHSVKDWQQHPFAALNELQQKGFIQTLLYEDCGCEQMQWKARVFARGGIVGPRSLVAESSGGCKKDAKRRAAAALLEQYRNRERSSPHPVSSSPRTQMGSGLQDGMVDVGRNDRAPTTFLQLSDDVSTNQMAGEPNDRSATATCSIPAPMEVLLSRKQRAILQRADEHLEFLHQLAHKVASDLDEETVFVAIDVEWHESGEGEILEVGLSWTPKFQGSRHYLPVNTHHFVVEDFSLIRNGKHVPDNKDRFNFGKSDLVAYNSLADRMGEMLAARLATTRYVYLFGHTLHHDRQMLQKLSIPHLSPATLTGMCDIALAYQAKHRLVQPTKLSKMLMEYGIQHENLHNAGNDAHYTLQCAVKMMLNENVRSGASD